MNRSDATFGRYTRRLDRLGVRGTMLRKGRLTATVVSITDYGDPVSRVISRRKLCLRTVPRRPDGAGYDLSETIWRWEFEDLEAENLITFLRDEFDALGHVSAATGQLSAALGDVSAAVGDPSAAAADVPAGDVDSSLAALIELFDSEGIDTKSLVDALTQRNDLGALVAALASTDQGLPAAQGALIRQRRELVARLRQMAESPDTTETDLQRLMGETYWLFGGRYVGVADRRNLAPLDQYDVPLLGADGTLHIVELKGPNIPNLVRKHRNHWMVGPDVHEATSQAMNYLRTLDETGAALTTTYRNEFGVDYDMRRSFATVVIGHPAHTSHADKRTIEQTIRSYNAHLSRVEVITYATLLESAERALEFEDSARVRSQHK